MAQISSPITIAEARNLAETRGSEHPYCVVRGTVTVQPGNNVSAPGNFIVQDESGNGLLVRNDTVVPLRLWQQVEVRGTLDWNPIRPKEQVVDDNFGFVSIRAAQLVPLGMGTQFQGRILSRADAQRGLYPVELVRVRGTVMRLMLGDSSTLPGDTVDYVVIGPEPEMWAVIRRARNERSWLSERAIPGSDVELKGVLGFSSGAQEFRIRLRVPTDIAIIRPHSWFTLTHILVLAGSVAFAFLLCFAWIVLLKRTIRKRTVEIQEREALLRQAQKMEVLNQMAGGIAHDFNNILMAMTGYAELLLAEDVNEAHKGMLREILKAGQRGARLTRQLLTFSRRQPVTPMLIDVNELIAEFQPMLSRLVGNDIELRVDLASSPMIVKADRSQLEQVLINLAANARDAMPTGGTLRIATSVVTIAGQVHGIAPGSYVKLVVSDTGTGMDSRTASRVFEPFFTTKQIGKGTGLGLSTVYGIVRQSDGEVKVQSAVGEGTTFRVYLPHRVGPRTAGIAEKQQPQLGHCSGSVLVVEDEEQIRTSVSTYLRQLGFEVVAMRNGTDALNAALSREFDLLITDIVMPGMNGIELFDRLSSAHAKTKVIFVSGYAERAADYGVTTLRGPLVRKPFHLSELAQAVEQVLQLDAGALFNLDSAGALPQRP